MKKTLAIILSAVMALSVCACGGGAKPAETTTASEETKNETISEIATEENTNQVDVQETEEESKEEQKPLLKYNEHVVIGDYDVCVKDFYYSDRATDPDKDSSAVMARDDYCYANIILEAKYNGKTEKEFPFSFGSCALNYGDGYIFNSEREWFYDTSLKAWLNQGGVRPLTPAFGMAFNIEVPIEVRDNKSETLFAILGSGDAECLLYLRPDNDEDKEEIYQTFIGLLDSDEWNDIKTAYDFLLELGDYKNSELTARLSFFGYEDREYFKEYVKNLTPIVGDDLHNLLSENTFKMRNNYGGDKNGLHTITFFEDGSLDAKYVASNDDKEYTMYTSWKIENDVLILNNTFVNAQGKEKSSDYSFVAYQFDDTRYLLINDKDSSMILTIFE